MNDFTMSSDTIPNGLFINTTTTPCNYYTTSTNSWTLLNSQPYETSYITTFSQGTQEIKEKKKEKKKPQRRENPYTKKIEEHLKRQNIGSLACFKYIKEYVPNKVYEFTFYNGDKIKTICDDSDIFDLEKAFYIAIAKRYHPNYTPEGHLKKAEEYAYNKDYIKVVKNGMKLFNLILLEEEFEKDEDERLAIKHEKYVQKKKERALKKKETANQDLYNTIKKAIEDAK